MNADEPILSRADADRQLEAGLQRHKLGDVESAYETYRRVLAQHPEHPTALHYLGLVAQQAGRSEDAARLLRRSSELDPNDPRVFNHLGQVVLTQGRIEEAIGCFEQALVVDPRHPDSLNSLANTLKSRGALQEAIALYRRALENAPLSALSHYNLANTLKQVGRYDEALLVFARALECEPDHSPSHLNLAVLLEQKGHFEEAAAHYQSVLTAKPDHPKALANLIAICSHADPQLVHAAEQRLEATDLESGDRIKLHYGLGKYCHREQDFDRAFGHYAAMNAVLKRRHAPFDPRQVGGHFDRLIETFSESWFARLGNDRCPSERPVFIVGMPRSGTTLTEQILARHPAVFGAGELQDIPRLVQTLKPRYPDSLAAAKASAFAELSQRYLAALDARAPADKTRVTDKLPVNFMHLGFIAALFPNARVIHCRRDPLDVGLSCFTERFELGQDFTTDLANFGHYFLQYERLMQHWRRVLPLPMHEHRYEDLVTDQAAHSRALVAACDLPWDDACLDFQSADRTVLTPSRWQVRQPIYSTSVGRWRNYAAHMRPLEELLNERGYRYE